MRGQVELSSLAPGKFPAATRLRTCSTRVSAAVIGGNYGDLWEASSKANCWKDRGFEGEVDCKLKVVKNRRDCYRIEKYCAVRKR